MSEKSKVEIVLEFIEEHGICVAGDRVVVVRDAKQEKTSGGIILAEDYQPNPIRGEVVATKNGWPPVGTIVYFRPYAESTLPLGPAGDGPEVCLVHVDDILLMEGGVEDDR